MDFIERKMESDHLSGSFLCLDQQLAKNIGPFVTMTLGYSYSAIFFGPTYSNPWN